MPSKTRSRASRLAQTIMWSSRSVRWSSLHAFMLSFAATPATVAVQAAESPTIQLDGLEINRDARSVTVDGSPVRLTPTEYSILLYLVEHRGSVVAVEDLFRAVWNEDFMPGSNNTVMVHIRHLREKIGDDAQKPRFIKNVWGVGYIIE